MIETEWRHFGIEGVGSGRLAARGRDVLDLLAKRGVPIAPRGRLERAVERIERVNADPGTLHTMSEAEADLLLEATRDVFDAFLVLWAAIERPRRVNLFSTEKLAALSQGTDSADTDSNPWPRNTQFELVVGAHFLLGGADLVVEEPDYSVLYQGRRVGLAIKRLSSISPNTLQARLRRAAHQISTSTGEGFAVVNLDNWITDLGGGSAEDVGRRFKDLLQEAYKAIGRVLVPNERLLGILILGTWLRWHQSGGRRQLEWKHPFQFIGFADTETQEAAFMEYMEGLRARWENSMRDLHRLLAAA